MVKWVARLAILAAFLGVVGTIVIIFHLHRRQNKEQPKDKINNGSRSDSSVDTLIIKPQPKPLVSLLATKPAVVIKKKDTARKVLPEKKENPENSVNLPVTKIDEKEIIGKVAIAGKGDKGNEVKKDEEEKLFRQEELQQIVSRINEAKESNNISSNCVQIFSTTQTNKTRTISQVETYLRSQRFAIAGRETISKKVKGIQITPAGGCIRVTIGSL